MLISMLGTVFMVRVHGCTGQMRVYKGRVRDLLALVNRYTGRVKVCTGRVG